MNRIYLGNFFTIKICKFITMRFYFSFQKIFMKNRVAIKFFFFLSALTLSQIVLYFFNKSSSSIKKYIHLVCPPYLFAICTRFWKHYMSWFNFIIIIQITNIFFYQKKSCKVLTLSQYLHLQKKKR